MHTATIIARGRTIMVKPERWEIDGEHAASIVAEAREIPLSLRRGQVHMVADGSGQAPRNQKTAWDIP